MIANAGITDKKQYYPWVRGQAGPMREIFEYPLVSSSEGNMPPITSLVGASFHPVLPVVLLNYTRVANSLYKTPSGWTNPLRICRGVVFERSVDARLVALAWEKFFNKGEMTDGPDLFSGRGVYRSFQEGWPFVYHL
ncbi:MAG: hypothetical protein WC797_03885 [Candidatus Paceibacterota bacterium]